MLNVVMVSVIMLSVVMLNVVAPMDSFKVLQHQDQNNILEKWLVVP